MKKIPQTPAKRGRPRKKSAKKIAVTSTQADTHPRCSRCGSRTVNLEQLEQELLVTLSVHCLICGHHSFIGRPVIRLLKRPNVTIPESITRPAKG
jgi:ribosomal protein L37E